MTATNVRGSWSSGDAVFSGTGIVKFNNDGGVQVDGVTIDASTLAMSGLTASAAELNLNDGAVAGTSVASKTLALGANKETDILALPVSGLKIGAGAGTAVDTTAAELNTLGSVVAGTVSASKAVVVGANKNVDTLANAAPVLGADATAGAATSARRGIIAKTAIADNTATDILTVTVPNANHAAALKITLLSSNGADRPYESSRCAEGLVVLARTSGKNVVATAASLALTAIATVSSGATHTLAYAVSAISGAVGATNTFTITVTIVGSGGTPASHNLIATYELINSQASGITVAAA